MNSRTVLNLGLAAAAMAAAIVLISFRPEPGESHAYALVPVAPAQIRSIEIERANAPTVRLRREQDRWLMVEPVAARLDDTALARVLDLSRLGASNKLSAEDPARYGLDKPWARVRFQDHVLEFGNTNTLTEELYVRSRDAVYAVPARNATAVPGAPARLIARRLFPPEETLALISAPGFSVRHDGTRWQLTPADPGLSQDDLVRWVEQWRYAISITTQPGAPGAGADVVVELRDGRRIELGIKARSPDLVLHRGDESLDYHFNERMAALLLASPSATANHRP